MYVGFQREGFFFFLNELLWFLRRANIQSWAFISTWHHGMQWTRAVSAQVPQCSLSTVIEPDNERVSVSQCQWVYCSSNQILKCIHLLLMGLEFRFLFIYFTLLCPDGEEGVSSLTPAHSLSSVSWPGSVEALSPYSLQVSPCCLLFVLFSFDFEFPMQMPPSLLIEVHQMFTKCFKH